MPTALRKRRTPPRLTPDDSALLAVTPSSLQQHLLVVGPPATGRTTFIRELAQQLVGHSVTGFWTDERCENGLLTALRAYSFDDLGMEFARVGLAWSRRVDEPLGIDVHGINDLVIPRLARPAGVILNSQGTTFQCRWVNARRRIMSVVGVLDGGPAVRNTWETA